ncbi:MAG: ATP-binding protein [Planctomycetota bacterium]|nr:ATP-binding protein [Planctomycetota bacterium]
MPLNNAAVALQSRYIVDNPFPASSRENLKAAGDLPYDLIHSRSHPFIREFRRVNSLYDIFIVDSATGDIVYTVFKEIDFGTNLINGPLRETNIAAAFSRAREMNDRAGTVLVDFGMYLPSYLAPAAFVATPIIDNGETIAVAIFQVPLHEIDRVMTGNRRWKTEGLGQTGETYLVGPDMKMRSDSREFIEDSSSFLDTMRDLGEPDSVIENISLHNTTVLFQSVQTEAVRLGLEQGGGSGQCLDFTDNRVFFSSSALGVDDIDWVVVSEIDESEVLVAVHLLKKQFIVIALILSLMIAVVALAISNRFAWPIMELEKDIRQFGNGDLTTKSSVSTNDEIGSLAKAFNQMADDMNETLDKLIEADKLIAVATMVSGVGHEINNPNSYIMMNAESCLEIWRKVEPALREYAKRDDADVLSGSNIEFLCDSMNEMLVATLDGSRRIKGIVSDMRRFTSQGETGMISRVDLNEVVESSIAMVKRRLDEKDVDLRLELQQSEVTVSANSAMLEQVLTNLITNAVDSIERGAANILVVTEIAEDGTSVLKVTDNGCGIPEDIRKRIMDPFFTTKRTQGGSGLGLPVSLRIVKRFGGELTVTSTEGKGSVVTVSFPPFE